MKVDISAEQIEYGTHSSNVIDKAKVKGLKVVFPDEHTLQLDIDDEIEYSTYKRMLPFFKKYFPIVGIEDWFSKSGGVHRHITITLKEEVTVLERIVLQLALGSDPKRELFSFIRFNCQDERPTIFVEEVDYGN